MHHTSGATKRKQSTLLDSSGSKKAKLGTSLDDARKLKLELESIEQKLGLLNEKIEKTVAKPPPAPAPTYDDIDNELQDLVDVADSDSFSDDRANEDHEYGGGKKKSTPRSKQPKRERHSKRQTKPATKYRAGEPDLLDVETAGPISDKAPAAPRRRPTPRKKAKPVLPAPEWKPFLKSSSAPKPNSKATQQTLKECAKVLKELTKLPDAWPFLIPVDPVKLNLPDYPTIVTNPMDLGTVEQNLKDGAYQSSDAFQRDVKLTFDNAMLYNPVHSDVHNMASELMAIFEKKFQKVLDMESAAPTMKKEMLESTIKSLTDEKARIQKQITDLQERLSQRGDTDTDDKSPPLRPREQFLTVGDKTCTSHADRCKVYNAVNGLQDKYMQGIILILQQELPGLVKTSTPVCEVDIDALSPTVLRRLLAYVEDCVDTDTRGGVALPPPNPELPAETNGTNIKAEETAPVLTEANNPPEPSSGTASSETSDTSSSDSDD